MTNLHARTDHIEISSVTLILALLVAITIQSPRVGADESEWVSVFDGRTLDGWHTNKEAIGKDTGGHWIVEDGAIAVMRPHREHGHAAVRAELRRSAAHTVNLLQPAAERASLCHPDP